MESVRRRGAPRPSPAALRLRRELAAAGRRSDPGGGLFSAGRGWPDRRGALSGPFPQGSVGEAVLERPRVVAVRVPPAAPGAGW